MWLVTAVKEEKPMNNNAVVEIKNIKKYFPLRGIGRKNAKCVKAVDGISLKVYEGETLGLVGESGSGKTTLAKMILGLLPPTESTVLIEGKDIWKDKTYKGRGRDVSAVFQDPASSLNPRATIYKTLERPLIINGCSKEEAKERIFDTVDKVNLRRELLDRFPNELSGGQQQRVSIARAISLMPRILVLDEPTSALDVSVQAQTLNELLRIQKELNMTYIFITHNLSVVRYMSDRICVMYGGKVMEIGKTEDIYKNCLHPYTLGLMSSVPPLHPRERNRKKYLLSGDMPSLIDIGEGCRFCSRCKFRKEICKTLEPPLKETGGGHYVACHFAGDIDFDN